MSAFGNKLGWCILAIGIALVGVARAETEMERQFQSPPAAARPWAYWWWLNSNVTRQGITRDLEEMHRQGIQGVMIFNAGGGDSPQGPKFLSPEWNALFRFALSEAARLGMEMSVNLCDGWCAGGPWIPAEAANKKLVWSETQIDGPRAVSQALPQPPTVDNFYRDVAVLAIREKPTRPVQPAEIRASSTVGGYCGEWNWPPADVADGDPNTIWRASVPPTPTTPAWLDYVYSEPLAASAIFLANDKNGGVQNCAIQVSDDGISFKTHFLWKMGRGEAKRVEFPEVKAKVFRLVVQSVYTPDVRLAEMWILRKGDEPPQRLGIKWWWFKSGNRGFWDWPKQGPAVMDEEYADDGARDCRSSEVIDLTSEMDEQGKLHWQAPKGRWTILRFGYTLEGQRTRCSSTVIGYEADMLDPIGIETHFKHCAEPLLDAAGPYVGKTLKYLHVDSYETGADVLGQQPTWSAKFLDEFRARRGYDPLRYLPAMARRIVDSREISDRFLFDIRMTISDLMIEKFFGRLAEMAHARGVGIHCETGYGTYPHPQFDGLRAAGQCDVTMGEFWWGTDIMSQFYPFCNVIRSVASPAHIYGRKIVQAESFTAWSHFLEYPATLKPLGDEAFCDGLNRVMFHQYTHQPNEDMPGYQYGAGTHIDRHVTWWNMSKPFLTYLARCQNILQAGRFHADVCYFTGEGTSKYVPGKRYLKPALPPGCNYDCINADVLLNRLSVKGHKLALPGGTTYRLLILPSQRTLSPAVLRRIKNLIKDGATVLAAKPVHTPGLTNWPEGDAELKRIGKSLWQADTEFTIYRESEERCRIGTQAIGKGRLWWSSAGGYSLQDLRQDLEAPDRNDGIEFIHRVIQGAHFYFVSNQTNRVKQGDFSFFVRGWQPEFWDPVQGTRRDLPDWTSDEDQGEGTQVPLKFEPYQSFFVVFSRPTNGVKESHKGPNFPMLKQVATIAGPWTVAFDPKWGGPKRATFERLEDWTKRPEEGIKYYSGTAVYRKTFDLAELPSLPKKGVFLDLGTVDYLARVRLNGRDLGVIWTAPWRVDISGVLKEKGNELEIEVVNTWLNRLVGDAHLPPEKRVAKTNIQYPPTQPLMPSGLLGPVTVQREL
jgi:hypothetical protein